MKEVTKHRILLSICAIAITVAVLSPRIPQNPDYHRFADQSALLAIPNALNVLTNLLFILVGLFGLNCLLRQKSLQVETRIHAAYLLFFGSLVFIGLGSALYHWSPDNRSLTLDRLPMTLAFMSFFTILIGERISLERARSLFPLMLLAGITSVAYWHYSELSGRGDLRPYAVVVFLPALLTPFFLLMYRSRYDRNRDIWWFLGWYILSKLCEMMDREIYEYLGIISGHSLKHVAASIGCFAFLRHLQLRSGLKT